ncbi:MAG: CapA family protein, partial [Muribaculaceae bacterium]|nr:CapA family protein [Muribaculaceae bacterium]
GAEFVCVAVHWGDEYKLLPNNHQKSLADFLFANGVDMVIGGHPHVIQPMEMRVGSDGRNRFLVYSLGNFISNMKTRDTRGGAIARVHLTRDGAGNAVISSADYDLVFTVPGDNAGDNFRLVFPDSCDSRRWSPHADAFSSAALNIFDKHNINVNRRNSR